MAVRFNSNTDELRNSTIGLGTGDFTYLFWGKITTNRSAYSTFAGFDNGTATQVCTIQTEDGTAALGRNPYLWVEPMGADGFVDLTSDAAMTVGTWYRFAVTREGDTITYYQETASGIESASGDLTGTLTCTNLKIGDSITGGEWLNGAIANLKIYNDTLTQTEIEAEWGNWRPQRTANLVAHYKFQTGLSTTDDSGNGNTLTQVGTPITEATAPTDPSGLGDSDPVTADLTKFFLSAG